MEQNSEPVDTPSTSKGQNQAQNVESILSSQTTKVMKNIEAVLKTVLMMKDLETDPQSFPLIRRCMIVLKRISDLEMDLQCLPIRKRALIVRDRIIGQTVGGSATCSHHDCRTGEQININYSDLVMKNLEAVLQMLLMIKDFQSIPLIKRCMIVLKRISDLEMDLQCLPIRRRALIVRNRIGQNMERNLEPVDTPLTSMSQNQAQNVESTLSSQTIENQACRIAPSVEVYSAAQCSICFKWRFLSLKEKFEEICERNSEQPFVCADVSEWRPEISCNDDTDCTEDTEDKIWSVAIERPNIARPPLGWERLVKIRGSGGNRFADVYYVTPSRKRLRSKAEVQRYLLEHPDEEEGVDLSRFSFQPPMPWEENFLEGRTDQVHASSHSSSSHSSEVPQDRLRCHRMPSDTGDENQQASLEDRLRFPTWPVKKRRGAGRVF